MKSKNIFVLLTIIFIIIIIFIITFLKDKKEKKIPLEKIPKAVEVPQKEVSSPLPIIEEENINNTSTPLPILSISTSVSTTSSSKIYQNLFNQEFIYIDLYYPFLYVYDPKNYVIKYFDLENETYREIIKIYDFKNAWLNEDRTKIIIETDKGFVLIDFKTDNFYNLSPFVKNFIFTPDVWLYFNNDKNISQLVKFQNGKITKIRDLGILNPEFALLQNGILIYEKNSPLFLLDFKNPSTLKVFLDGNYFDVLVNKNKDSIFLIFAENEKWKSKVINLKKENKYIFPWATNKEKCSFEEVLVCSVPTNFDPQAWLMLNPSYDEKIIIYDPRGSKIKEINLEDKFDFVKPKVTPLGIIAWDRLSAKFYLIKNE